MNRISQGSGIASDAVPNDDEVVIERGGAATTGIPGVTTNKNRLFVGGSLIAAAAVFGIAAATGMLSSNAGKEKPTLPATETAYRVKDDGVVAPQLADAGTDPNAPVVLTPDQVPAIDGTVTPAGQTNQPSQSSQSAPRKSEAQVLREAARRSTLVAYGGSSGVSDGATTAGQGGVPNQASGTDAPLPPTALDRLRQTSRIARVSASSVGNRDLALLAGAVLPCVLQTAMDSSQPGYATCVLPRDVYSDNGRVILMEKGTRVLGEYQGGIEQGRYRLFVVWNRAITPRGVAVALGSPASDPLGRAGLPGGVQSFFWQRFGAALLFSVVDAAGQIGGQAASDAIGSNGVTNITRTPSQASQTIVADSQQIRPVLRKNQGEDVSIFVAQDFDFSDVYNLRLRTGR
ncbi:type IV secretion system protein VirB10 [Sphingomonas sp. PB2P19]|uniref:type IV secretion system protein VirB10 n=1 Tax=Sphingomonas rhamnosi TaxID=3096156 RepID=UPI002FC9F81F